MHRFNVLKNDRKSKKNISDKGRRESGHMATAGKKKKVE